MHMCTMVSRLRGGSLTGKGKIINGQQNLEKNRKRRTGKTKRKKNNDTALADTSSSDSTDFSINAPIITIKQATWVHSM